jgi:hypothetical protein
VRVCFSCRIGRSAGVARIAAHAHNANAAMRDAGATALAASVRVTIALELVVAFALCAWAAMRATPALRPMRQEKQTRTKAFDVHVSDFDWYNHRGRAVAAFLKG